MKKKLVLCLLLVVVIMLCACGKKVYFSNYISDCKYNVLAGTEGDFSIKVNLSKKENPYFVDGVCGSVRSLIEIFLYTPDNTLNYSVFFEENSIKLGGEMNFCSSKSRHELSFEYCNENLSSIDFVVQYDDSSLIIKATSLIENEIMTPDTALNTLFLKNKELFTNMTLNNEFAGEIHIRLLAEGGKCYYYIGIINTTGKIFAYLMNAQSGDIIAQKEINYRTQLSV